MLTEHDFFGDPAQGHARRCSPETDYGFWYVDEPGFDRLRVSLVEDTSELYAVGLTGSVKDLVWILATNVDEADVDAMLDGWEDEDAFSWVVNRSEMYRPVALDAEIPALFRLTA